MPNPSPTPRQHFNSRPSARGDQPIPRHAREVLRFQFTPLREGRLADADVVFQRFHEFQFTPLREGRPPAYTRIEMIQLFQFTPLREGRHFLPKKKISRGLISIHAPPRGATFCVNFLFKLVYFNSRPSARGDEIAEKQDMSAGISIHAPPRGATALSVQHQKRQVNFNSRPSARGDEFPLNAGSPFLYFNSRPSARGDPLDRLTLSFPFYFNSRPSARGDSSGIRVCRHKNISIHAPPRGATSSVAHTAGDSNISIHAPPRGATTAAQNVVQGYLFQFTPLREGRRMTRCISSFASSFQFTPLREGRRMFRPKTPLCLISIHAPPRGATAKDMQFLQIFCSTLTNQHGLTIMPRNLSRLFW